MPNSDDENPYQSPSIGGGSNHNAESHGQPIGKTAFVLSLTSWLWYVLLIATAPAQGEVPGFHSCVFANLAFFTPPVAILMTAGARFIKKERGSCCSTVAISLVAWYFASFFIFEGF